MRLVKKHSADYAIALLGGMCDDNGFMTWGIEADHIFMQGKRPQGIPRRYRHRKPLAETKPDIDPEEFTQFEMRFRGGYIHAYVNGTFIGKTERWPFQHQGYMGLLCVYADAQFRGMEIRQP